MGAGPEWIEASSGNFGSCETHTKNLSCRQKEHRGCRSCTMGEVQGGEEEGSLTYGARIKPATSVAGFSL